MEIDPEILFAACADPANEDARRIFCQTYTPLIRKVVARMLARRGAPLTDGDDLVHNIFLRLFKNDCRALARFRPTSPNAHYGYVKRIAVNETLDHFRSKSHRVISIDSVTDTPKAASTLEQDIEFGQVLDKLDEITRDAPNGARNRKIFLLHHRVGLTARQIAALPSLDLTLKGVESALRTTLESVRAALQSDAKSVKSKNAVSRAI